MSDWRERMAQVSKRLAETPPEQRALFAAGVAERLLRAHEARPADRQDQFTIRLRPLLDLVWAAACGDQTVTRDITQRLGQFYATELDDDAAEEDAAAAVLHAAECYTHGTVEYAVWAGDRATFAADETVQAGYRGDWAPAGESAGAIQRELQRQWHDLEHIAGYAEELRFARSGLPDAVTRRLLAELRPELARPLRAELAQEPDSRPELARPLRGPAQQGEDPVEG